MCTNDFPQSCVSDDSYGHDAFFSPPSISQIHPIFEKDLTLPKQNVSSALAEGQSYITSPVLPLYVAGVLATFPKVDAHVFFSLFLQWNFVNTMRLEQRTCLLRTSLPQNHVPYFTSFLQTTVCIMT